MKLNKCKLSDLGTVNRGKSKHRPRNDVSLFDGEYPFIQTGEVKATDFYLNSFSETYNEKGLAQSKLWDEGTLLITISANIAETAILDIKACFPDSIIGFIPFENKSDVRFVKYYLDYIKKKLQNISQGTTQDNMSVKKLLSMWLYVPEYENQVKIANILSNYDQLIENNNQRIKLLESMAEEIYKEWFVRLRFPDYEKVESVDGLPFGWEKKPLTEVGIFLNGYAFKPKDLLDEGLPIIKIKEMKNGIVETTPRNYGLKMDKKYLVTKGEILFSWSASLAVVQWQHEDGWLNQHLFKVTPKKNISKSLLFFQLKELLDTFNNLTTGATMKHIRRSELDIIEVYVPSSVIIKKFEKIINPILDEVLVLNTKNKTLKETRDLLLPRLINGKLT